MKDRVAEGVDSRVLSVLENLKAAVAVHAAFYNFARLHRTLRVTPAMEAGLTDHIWSTEREGQRSEAAA